jgi:ribonuclease HI
VTVRVGQTCRLLRGHEDRTTSNILLLKAAIAALTALGEPCQVAVYTVSDYLGKGAGEWVKGWQQHGWRTSKGQPVKNRTLWEALIEASQSHSISWHVVRGGSLPADLVRARETAARQVGAKETRHAH